MNALTLIRHLLPGQRRAPAPPGPLGPGVHPDDCTWCRAGVATFTFGDTRTTEQLRAAWAAAFERDSAERYTAEVRRQRHLARWHGIQLAEDAWARYGWTRPTAVRR